LRAEFTPEVTPPLITQLPTEIPPKAHPHTLKSCRNSSLASTSAPARNPAH
jgi:hypothetical protein